MDRLSITDLARDAFPGEDWLQAFSEVASLIGATEDKMTDAINTFRASKPTGYTTIMGTKGQAVMSLSDSTIFLIWVKLGHTEYWVTRTSLAHHIRLKDHSLLWKPRQEHSGLTNPEVQFDTVCGCSPSDLEKDFPTGPVIARMEDVCRPPRARDALVAAQLKEAKHALEKQLEASEDQNKLLLQKNRALGMECKARDNEIRELRDKNTGLEAEILRLQEADGRSTDALQNMTERFQTLGKRARDMVAEFDAGSSEAAPTKRRSARVARKEEVMDSIES